VLGHRVIFMSKISSENSSAFDFKGDENPAPRFWFLSKKFQQDASLLIKEFWKFRRFTFIGLIALVIVDLLELIPPYLLKLSVDSLVEKKPVETLFWFGGFYILGFGPGSLSLLLAHVFNTNKHARRARSQSTIYKSHL
jgi:ABC-type bacteriocin/lantibiotic exporter with double-glycine peptidase domain